MELKFRAWNYRQKQMILNALELIKVRELIKCTLDLQSPFMYLDGLEWLQYSGMKDKNTTEIYDGDILKLLTEDEQEIFVVCRFGSTKRVMDTGWEVNITGFYFERPDGLKSFPIVGNWEGKNDLDVMEIVGNIYENPNLIKVQ